MIKAAMHASLVAEVGRSSEKLQGIRMVLVDDPSLLLLIVLFLTCTIEFVSDCKPIILNHACQKRLLAVCLVLFCKGWSLGCRSAVHLQL